MTTATIPGEAAPDVALAEPVAAAATQPALPALGIIYNEPSGLYHGTRAVSWHRLSKFDPAAGGQPALYHLEVIQGKSHRGTKPKELGSAAHTLLLEGESAYQGRYKEVPKGYKFNEGEGKKWKTTFEQSLEKHKDLIKSEDAETVRHLECSFRGHPVARELFAQGRPEVVVRRVEPVTGLLRQCRFDWLDEERFGARDLKTTSSPIERFGYEVQEYFYHRQVMWYSRLYVEQLNNVDGIPFEEVEPFAKNFQLIAAETFPTWRIQPFDFDSETLRNADAANARALYELSYCYQNNVWPDASGATVTLTARS